MANVRKEPNKFQQHCIEKGLTAAKVADLIGVSERTVYSYYRGERLPSRKTCKQIQDKMGVDPYAMFQ